MKGKNWRDYGYDEVPYRQHRRHRRKKRKRGLLRRRLMKWGLLFCLGAVLYLGYTFYMQWSKPYTVALDAGHGGEDSGAEGLVQEAVLTEDTVEALEQLLRADGRFRIVLTRKEGETMSINDRKAKLQRAHADLILSIHGNAEETGDGYGFECYPSPPGRENYEISLRFGQNLAEAMEQAGARLRGDEGIRYGYYIGEEKWLTEETTVYDYPTFGILEDMDCPAVLAEQCFITNAQDVEDFASPQGIQKAAQAYYQAICHTLGIEPIAS
jgi:N-acetylmuramoyl-L-alanine amidase